MSTTSFFDTAHVFTARWEGGLTDHPSDPGGITQHGVSLRWLRQLEAQAARQGDTPASAYDFNSDGRVDANDIRACTKAQAAALFKKHFWDTNRCDALPHALALVVYDMAVNAGSAVGVRLVQASCNTVAEAYLDTFTPLAEDGQCGPRTIACCRALAQAHLDFYTARHAVRARQAWYTSLVRTRADLSPFLKGWHNRCTGLLEYLAQLEREV